GSQQVKGCVGCIGIPNEYMPAPRHISGDLSAIVDGSRAGDPIRSGNLNALCGAIGVPQKPEVDAGRNRRMGVTHNVAGVINPESTRAGRKHGDVSVGSPDKRLEESTASRNLSDNVALVVDCPWHEARFEGGNGAPVRAADVAMQPGGIPVRPYNLTQVVDPNRRRLRWDIDCGVCDAVGGANEAVRGSIRVRIVADDLSRVVNPGHEGID